MENDFFSDLKVDIFHDSYSAPLSTLSVKVSPLLVNERIKKIEKNGYRIDEDSYYYIDRFLSSPFYDTSRKLELKKHLDDNYKEYLFNKLFYGIDNIPLRLNGVPYVENNIKEIPSSEIKDFLLTGNISEERKNSIMFYSTVIDFCKKGYFSSEFCCKKVIPQLERLKQIDPIVQEEKKKISLKEDAEKISAFYKQFQNGHSSDIRKYHVSEKFKQQMLSIIPSDFTDLEKSIYIYLRLCDCFSYDAKFFASAEKYAAQHENISNVEQLSIENANVVCFEFTYVLSDLLSSIGVECVDNISYFLDVDKEGNIYPDLFMINHANLKFIADDIIVFADSTRSVLQGDIAQRKYSKNPNGIRCENYSIEARSKFHDALVKVSNFIEQDQKRFHISETIAEYAEFKKNHDLDMSDKMNFLYNKIVDFPYNDIDLLSYIYTLSTEVFERDELYDNLSLVTVRNHNDDLSLIMSANKFSFHYSPYNTQYYQLNFDTREMQKIMPNQLYDLLQERRIQLVDQEDFIPNLAINSQHYKNQLKEMVSTSDKEQGTVNGHAKL